MADKVQKIKEWISKTQDGLMNAQGNFEYPEHEGAYHILCNLDAYIDSMQEEPVGELLNTESMIESYKQRLISQANGVKNSPLVDMCLASYKHGINETLDTLNLSNAQRTIKNWKEPVSEDLVECTNEIILEGTNFNKSWYAHPELAFKAGAKWQEKQDQKTIELAEDHAMLAGMEKMKEQMMAKAIDAHCFGFQGAALFTFRLPAGSYLVGSEVKVIVIKED